MTMKRTTARGKTVVKVKFKFTLFRVIVKCNFAQCKTRIRGEMREPENTGKDNHEGTGSTKFTEKSFRSGGKAKANTIGFWLLSVYLRVHCVSLVVFS